MNETAITTIHHADFIDHLKHAGILLYLVNPYETTFEFPHEVPDYQQQIWIPFFALIILEQLILSAKKKGHFRLNDQVTSLSHWIFQESCRIFFRGAEYYVYIMIYEKYCLWSLPWDSTWTWFITALAVDFCYYWVHRSNHEILLLWAQHQVHHSSEEFNLAVGLRQSILQHWCNFILYLPLALFIPPSHFIVHNQFNLIYQLWIHTTVIDDLGPLELIFNTPKHHRVHHGCNLYCLDTNYGGVFIIWDRLFGTFMQEREEIIYGLVSSPQSFNPLYLQIFYTKGMIDKSRSMKSLVDKIGAIWKGPSWLPGAPRLGLDEHKINVTSRIKYDTYIPTWQNLYIVLHFFIVFYKHLEWSDQKQDFSSFTNALIILNNISALTVIGLLFEKFEQVGYLEFTRCMMYLLILKRNSSFDILMYYVYIVSCGIWIYNIVRRFTSRA